jgi:nitrate/TMAO reductase-like tetraheme cytochrome c subunit
VKRLAVVALPLLLAAAAGLAATSEPEAIPKPHGWVGTTLDWAQGLGLAFAILTLLLLLVSWRSLRRQGETPLTKQLMFFSIGLLPLTVVFLAYVFGMESSKSVEACNSCHIMNPYAADLRDPKSDTLAAVHYKNQYIQDNHCYTCHSDYGMFGTMQAKFEGLGHIVKNTTGAYETPLKIAHPYTNLRCLNCHGRSQAFLDPDKHPPEDLAKMVKDEVSCLDCHGPPHPRPAEKTASK